MARRNRVVSGARGLFDLLAEFGHSAGGEHAFPMDARVDDRFAAEDGTGAQDGVASDFGAVADDGAEFFQSGRHAAVRTADDDLPVIKTDIERITPAPRWDLWPRMESPT